MALAKGLAALLPLAYLAGSVNFAILLLRVLGKPDPRSCFSGNPGATNVYREAGLGWAALVVALDVSRAAGVAAFAQCVFPRAHVAWVLVALLAGNRFPLFHRFRGGKGVANFLGFAMGTTPLTAAISALAWVGLFLVTRTSFIASFLMVAVLCVGTLRWAHFHPSTVVATILIGGAILHAHRSNIRALRRKEGGTAP